MAKKEIRKTYIPSDSDIDNFKFCIKRDIAFSIKRLNNEEDAYYIQKYKPSKYNVISNLRINKSLPDIPSNRMIFKEYDAWKEIYNLYSQTRKSVEKTPIESVISKPVNKILEKADNIGNQIDLLDSIEEIEKENASAKQK